MDDSASATLEEGHEHHRAGRLKEAHDVYKVVVTNEPENAAAHYLLGTLYMQGGNNELAVDLLAKAVDLEGGNQEYRCNLGTALLQVGRLEEGLGLLKETLEAEPDHLLAHTNLAHAYAESGDTVLAENHLKAIIRIDSRNARAYGDMGVIMAKRGAFDRALENFRRALDLQPGDPDFQINLANALLESGDIDAAIPRYERLLKEGPRSVLARFHLGVAHERNLGLVDHVRLTANAHPHRRHRLWHAISQTALDAG